MFPIWSKFPSAFLFQCWCQAGTWIPPEICCTFLEREKKIDYSSLRRKCCEVLAVTQVCRTCCFIQVLFFPMELCGRILRPHTPSSPVLKMSRAKLKQDQPLLSSPPEGPLTGLQNATLASCPCSSPLAAAGVIHIPSFSPPTTPWHC